MRDSKLSVIGILEAFVVVTAITVLAVGPGILGEETGLALIGMPPNPSADLLRGIAQLGGALVLAYVVQAAWLVREAGPREFRDGWVGYVTGAGLAGFVGVILALMLAEHRAAGHDNLLDRIGFFWVAVSLIMLAGVVIFQPLLVHQLQARKDAEKDEGTN